LRIHFGLGDERQVSLEIHWPSGTVQELKNVASDQQLNVEEPKPSAKEKRNP
jgi:enediyne biosynthesis protein E4